MNRYDERNAPSAPPPAYDAWLLPPGVSQFSAKPEQLAMLTIPAASAIDVRWHPDVRALLTAGWHVEDIVPSGTASTVAMKIYAAARQALDDSDRPSGYRSANDSRPPWVR